MQRSDEWLECFKNEWKKADLEPREEALCAYAEKLTREPASLREEDVEALRASGLDDEAIIDLVHVIGFFAHANRIADGLGIDFDPWMSGSRARR